MFPAGATIRLIAFTAMIAQPVRPAEPPLEYKVKAVFVLNAARFVTWPNSAFADGDSPFVIGVVGENPFGSLLADAVAGETVQKRRIVTKRVAAGDPCHILFIGRSEEDRLPRVLELAARSNSLTISEIDGFARNGGMIGLFVQGGSVRFEVNPDAAARANLKLDARLLRLAKIVK
jgi:hypothetical protein